jgi:hypothetical protein
MAMSLNSYDQANCGLSSNVSWAKLYDFLGAQVRYWVCSSHVSLWQGQEEDIIADIVQEAVIRTFRYALVYSSWREGREDVSYKSLEQISTAIAYKEYRDLERQDSRFLWMRLRKSVPQGQVIMSEHIDPVETIHEHAFEEWHFVHLASEIADIPTKPRTALLIDLANRMHFNDRPTPMQDAFLKVGIQLKDYQRPLPKNPRERSSHMALLHLACEQLMRQQKRFKEQYAIETMKSRQEATLWTRDSDPHYTEGDPELIALAAYLDATAPLTVVDPTFRQTLRDRLVNILAEKSAAETVEVVPNPAQEMTDKQRNVESVSSIRERSLPSREPDSSNIGDDPELIALAAYLDATAPLAAVDPAFRQTLRDKLLGTQAERSLSEEKAPDSVTGIADNVFQESLLISLAHEIADFPDDERIALLIDLANRTSFGTQPTRLEQAFLGVGIRLQDYTPLVSEDPIDHDKHVFFLNLAYKRVAEIQEALCPC